MDRFEEYSKMMEAFFEGARIIYAYDKKPRNYGVHQELYMAEMHTLVVIADKQGMTITELAEMTHKTKSAVTQMTNKLQKKKMITKSRSKEYYKEVELFLTDHGRMACEYHRALDESNYTDGLKHLGNYSAEDLKKSAEIFAIVTQTFKSDVLDKLNKK